MAQIHNQLRRTPLGAALKKAIGDQKGGDAGLERYGETLQPTIDLWSLPEWSTIRQERLSAVRSFQGAIAAEFGGVAIGNPVGSNAIVVVEAVTFQAGTAMSVFLEVLADTVISGTLAVVVVPGSQRDRRFGGGNPGRAFIRSGTDPTNTFGAQLEVATATLTGTELGQARVAVPIILQPGDDLLVIGQTVNVSMNVCFKWRERAAFPGELG